MTYVKWLLKLIVFFIVMAIILNWTTNPWNIDQLFPNLSTGNIILISRGMFPITVLVFLVAIPLVLRPLPFVLSDTTAKSLRTLYLVVSYVIVNLLQKAFFRQNEIVLTGLENIALLIIFIIVLFVIYKTFVSRAWIDRG